MPSDAGCSFRHLLSRNGILAVTAVASALLVLPVVAIGKGKPEGVGGGTDTAAPQGNRPSSPPGQTNRPDSAPGQANRPDSPPGQANGPSSPPGQANRPDPPPGQANRPSSPPGQANRHDLAPQSARPGAPPHGTPGWAHANGKAPGGNHTGAPSPAAPAVGPGDGAPDSGSQGEGAESGGGAGQLSHPDSPDVLDTGRAVERSSGSNGGAVAGAFAGSSGDDTIELAPDASPATLPFTGFQLMLIAIFGLTAVAAGLALRRGARHRRA